MDACSARLRSRRSLRHWYAWRSRRYWPDGCMRMQSHNNSRSNGTGKNT